MVLYPLSVFSFLTFIVICLILHESSIVGHCAANPKANVLAVKAMGIEAMVAQALEEILGEVLHKSNFAEKICIMELIQKKKLPDGLGDVSSFLRHLGVK